MAVIDAREVLISTPRATFPIEHNTVCIDMLDIIDHLLPNGFLIRNWSPCKI
jgi:hypothetical protein